MSLQNFIKKILGVSTVDIGKLNRKAAGRIERSSSSFISSDPPEDIEITGEYRKILALIEAGAPLIFVSGKAGTGKTTLVHYLRSVLKKNVAVVAPTGVAALNVKGATIHSFFRFPPRIIAAEDIREVRNRRLYEKMDILIVDEVSMVRADVLDAMDQFLRLNGPDAQSPFGGVQVVFVGDLFQLPPVVTRQEREILDAMRYETPFFFSAKVLQSCQFTPVELSKLYRQTDAAFTGMLDRIRLAEDLDTVIPALNEACAANSGEHQSLITLTCTNTAAGFINESKLRGLPGETRTFIGQISGTFNIQEDRLPSPLHLDLKLGAQVMFTKNDEAKRWVNGTIGRVIGFDGDSIRVELLSDPLRSVCDVGKTRWETFRYAYDSVEDRIKPEVMGEYSQYPLMLAWAVTIHKSQGKTLEKVKIDLGDGAFAPGQVYVALSRCRSLADMTLARPVRADEVKCDGRIKRFYEGLAREQLSGN